MKQPELPVDIKTVLCTEPRIDLIKRQLESLLAIVELEHKGEPVSVDGFRLKNLNNWKIPKDENPGEIIRYLSRMRNCSSHCEFCYIRGNPQEVIFNTPYHASVEEILTRMSYYFSDDPYMLYHASFDCEEVFSDPQCLDILKYVRDRTNRMFWFVTGGRYLTEAFIKELETLRPLTLNVSLNLANVARRQKIMGDKKAGIAVKSLPLLKAAKIPYVASLVGWFDINISDIEETIRYAAKHDARFVDIGLGGYTRLNPPRQEKDTAQWWGEITALAERMRSEFDCPIITVPALFEENRRKTGWREGRVTGVVKNSPACAAGIRYGDVIEEVGGFPFRSRPHLIQILNFAENRGIPLSLTIFRRGERISLTIEPGRSDYPYMQGTGGYGIMIPSGLSAGDLSEVIALINKHRARTPLVLSSALMKPSLDEALAEAEDPAAGRIRTCLPESIFFGGNIFMGDLMTVDDLSEAIDGHIKRSGETPDLIIIPSSGFGAWRRDLTGRAVLEIERRFGISTEFVNNGIILY